MGIFSNVNLEQVPGGLPKFVIVVFLSINEKTTKSFPEKVRIKLQVVDPDGEKTDKGLPELDVPLDLSKKDGILSFELVNFQFQKIGAYKFLILENELELGSMTLNVNIK